MGAGGGWPPEGCVSDDRAVSTSGQAGTTPAEADPAVGEPEGPAPRRRGMGTARNMVISMLCVLAFVLVWLALVPRPNAITQPPVDVDSVAQQVHRETGWDVLEPKGLPPEWRATSVRFVRGADDLQTWHAGYQSPTGDYVSVDQTRGASAKWLRFETGYATRVGSLNAAGAVWQKWSKEQTVRRSLVLPGASAKDLSTVVSGTASFAELAHFVEALEPVTPKG